MNKQELVEAAVDKEQIIIPNLQMIFDLLEKTKELIMLMELSLMLLEKLKDSITIDLTMVDL